MISHSERFWRSIPSPVVMHRNLDDKVLSSGAV